MECVNPNIPTIFPMEGYDKLLVGFGSSFSPLLLGCAGLGVTIRECCDAAILVGSGAPFPPIELLTLSSSGVILNAFLIFPVYPSPLFS